MSHDSKRSWRPAGTVLGDFLRICDRSGRVCLASDTRQEWTGLWVHKDLWEERQPQDFVRGKADNQTVPFGRPPIAQVELLSTNTDSGTSSASTIQLIKNDIGSIKSCSRMTLTLTMTSYDTRRDDLFISFSDDDVTYTDLDDQPTTDTLDNSVSGEAMSILLSENTRYWKVELRNNSGSVTFTSALDIFGDSVLNVTAGSL